MFREKVTYGCGAVGGLSVVRRLVGRLGRRLVRRLGLRSVAPRRVSTRTPLFKRNLNLSSVSTLRVVLVLRGCCKIGLGGSARTGPIFCSIGALTRCVVRGHG